MKNHMNHKQLFALLMIFTIAVSGCSLAPKEEVLPDAPVIPTSAITEYKKAKVIRGDIVNSVTIDCTYNAFQTESLKFKISGLRIDHVYVGDHVKAGEVLADLEMSDVSLQIEERKDTIKYLELRISHQKELKELSISNQNKMKSIPGYNKQIHEKYNQEISRYDNAKSKLEDSLYIEQERLAQLNEDIINHQIIAGMDGVVSYVASYQYGDTSDKEVGFISVYNPDTMVFVTDGTNSELFTPDQEVEIMVSKDVYSAVVIIPDEHINQANGNDGVVYLKVDNSEERLHKDDQGEITLILNERKDILYLPSSAVQEDNGKSIVYVEDEGGFKSIKEIKTGLSADRKVEVISGLNEGDSVILE